MMRTCFSSTSFSTPSAKNAFLIARFKRKTGGFFTSIPTKSCEISSGRSSVLKNSSVSAAMRESLLRLPVASPARFRSGIISLRIKFRVLSFSKLVSSTTYGTSYFFWKSSISSFDTSRSGRTYPRVSFCMPESPFMPVPRIIRINTVSA